MPLKKIRLELARDEDHPVGSPDHGYEFVAPLDENGRIDAREWQEKRDRCRVVRFWGSAEREHAIPRKRRGNAYGIFRVSAVMSLSRLAGESWRGGYAATGICASFQSYIHWD